MRSAMMVLFLAACGGGRAAAPDAPEVSDDASAAVPTEPAALQAWLAARTYQGWQAESAPHPSEGPHGGKVRTFVNAELAGSLAAATDHPAGAAAVKELYGDGDAVTGWAVEVKLAADSADGEGWYWYETFTTDPGGTADYQGVGLDLCTDCHVAGEDYVLSRFPLQ
jgi:hypothetical protein